MTDEYVDTLDIIVRMSGSSSNHAASTYTESLLDYLPSYLRNELEKFDSPQYLSAHLWKDVAVVKVFSCLYFFIFLKNRLKKSVSNIILKLSCRKMRLLEILFPLRATCFRSSTLIYRQCRI